MKIVDTLYLCGCRTGLTVFPSGAAFKDACPQHRDPVAPATIEESTMSGDLAGWLLTQISKDEAVADRAACDVWRYRLWNGADQLVDPEDGDDVVAEFNGLDMDAMHAARWHKRRVLAECAAKRAIIDLARQAFAEHQIGTAKWLMVLDALAAPYSDRPGFRPEWQVTP